MAHAVLAIAYVMRISIPVDETIVVLAVIAAYLIGAIPFGYLVAKWLKGVDIRTVGSGNIGATNVGRTFGFRFFVLVFLFDMAKGLLPTWGIPHLAGRSGASGLAVAVALATILGHNFPVYLGFKGGKGVATSLGALLALDPVAALASSVGFGVSLLITRYVSVSSIFGGLVFVVAHFVRDRSPWGREHIPMSVLTVALMALLVVRHRKNLGRIAAGTEPKVSLKKRPKDRSPSGFVAVGWLVALAAVVALGAAGVMLWSRVSRQEVLTVGGNTLTEIGRAGTGHQRAERVAFADGGKLLAVTCPRYNRLVLYRVGDDGVLETLNDLELDGKPMAICPLGDRLYVLERPPGDNRHVEPGWLEAFDLKGERVVDKTRVGFYPDDMALSPDGRFAHILTSGRAEGDAKKPAPALEVYDLSAGPKSIGRVEFDGRGDDPARLILSATGRGAAVTLGGSEVVAAVDLSDPALPRLIGRSPLARVEQPYVSRSADDQVVMPVASRRESLCLALAGVGECLVSTLPRESGLEVGLAGPSRSLGRLTLRSGTFGLGQTRPTGLAYSPERGLIAVANRSGGVHLVAIRAGSPAVAARLSGN
jgi:glycerol-3-phosphate acyltransferase PlsY